MITAQEYQQRMARLQRLAAEHGLDAFLVASETSIYYLTGISYLPFERPFFIIVRPGAPATLLVPALEKEHLRKAPNVDRVETYWDYPAPPGQGWADQLLALLDGCSHLGVEPALSQEIAARLAGHAPQVLPLVERLRLVKTPAEVEMVRQAARYADVGMAKAIAASYYGVSVIEIFAQGRPVQMQIIKETEFDAFATSVLVGPLPAPISAMPHTEPSASARLREGPHVTVVLMRVNGYAAECERTFFVAPPTPQVKEAWAAMQEARRRAFALVRPGVPCAEIDVAANGFLRLKGFGDNLLHRAGHGFGLGNHEGPWISEGSEDVLEENMIVSVEPGIYIPGVGGVRHSDTVLVTKGGYEVLTHYPTDMDALTIRAGKPLQRLQGLLVRRAVGLR